MLLWIIAKLLIHFLFAIIWEMKNMLFYMLLFHIFKQWGNYGDSSNTLIPLNLNITSAKMLFAIATDITNNGNPQGAYLGYDVIENNKIRFLFDATPWTFAWFCISK